MPSPGLFFEEFPSTSSAAWIEAIEHELRGRLSIETLNWRPEPDLEIRPFYRSEDMTSEHHALPRTRSEWLICDRVHVMPGMDLRSEVKAAQESGAEAVELIPQDAATLESLASCLDRLAIPALLFGSFDSLESSFALLSRTGATPAVWFLFDPVSLQFSDTTFDSSIALAAIAKVILAQNRSGRRFRVGCVDERPFSRSGAGLITSSACLLSSLASWIRSLDTYGVDISYLVSGFTAVVSVGTAFLPEIARLRALRHLIPQVTDSFGISERASAGLNLHAVTSDTALPGLDIHTNLIRTTTQALSAVLGGCDSLCVHPFDAVRTNSGSPNGRRLARNIQLILRDECRLGFVVDPLAGSYYIEALTDQLIEGIWERFLRIEDAGGLTESLVQGIPQQWTSDDRNRIRSATESGMRTVVGVTAYPDVRDRTEAAVTAPKETEFRSFDGIELFRSEVQARQIGGGAVPTIHLIGIGTPADQNRGITFAANFFACGGFPVTQSVQSEDLDILRKEVKHAKPSIIFACGSAENWNAKLDQIACSIASNGLAANLFYATYELLCDDNPVSRSNPVMHSGSHLLETLRFVDTFGSCDQDYPTEATQ